VREYASFFWGGGILELWCAACALGAFRECVRECVCESVCLSFLFLRFLESWCVVCVLWHAKFERE